MKELLSPYIGRGTWENFKLVPRAWGGVHTKPVWGGGGERKDMKHVNYETKKPKRGEVVDNVFQSSLKSYALQS